MNWGRAIGVGLVLAGLGGSALAAVRSQPWSGIVTHVTDGDTLWVRPARGGAPRRIRLDGIDAPEICQAYGVQARDGLVQLVADRRVRVLPYRGDDYGRTVARVVVQGQDAGRWLVLRGYAWSYRFRYQAGPYARQEAQARAQHVGLWQAPAESPRDFRRRYGSCH